MANDLLLEIGCEELPAKGLKKFAHQFTEQLTHALQQAAFTFEDYRYYVSPRRLAIKISALVFSQPDRSIEKRGPALSAPEAALQGFLRSCNATAAQLISREGYWYYQETVPGKNLTQCFPAMIQQVLQQFSGVKWMRWGNYQQPFWRPVEWTVLLWGTQLIDAEILGCRTQRETYGHRFHHPEKIILSSASAYEDTLLEEGYVCVDFERRRQMLQQQLQQIATTHQAQVLMNSALLEEVTGLVEWPHALCCEFDPHFLAIPKEALISAMQYHQKCFALTDKNQKLLPYFITVSNLKSQNSAQVIQGNERVMRARLADAGFFWQQDVAVPLRDHWPALNKVIFQEKLGSMADKVKRLMQLIPFIAQQVLHTDAQAALQAAELSKMDLLTTMVNEFPELQGIMGYYYAKKQGETEEIALAIKEHYLPQHTTDALPKSALGCALALADRLDTLVGIFGIGLAPTGDKDPFGLRRAAIGIIRILIEKNLFHQTLPALLTAATQAYQPIIFAAKVVSDVQQFILDRLPAYFQEQQITSAVLQAVLAVQNTNLAIIAQRSYALTQFMQSAAAGALIQANKRVKNILRKNNQLTDGPVNQENIVNLFTLIQADLFIEVAEKNLYTILKNWVQNKSFSLLITADESAVFFKELAQLHAPLDQFFAQVMVEVSESAVKNNRLLLLQLVRALFLQIADISLLS